MQNLENLAAKIISDGEKRAQEILADAKAQADALISEHEAQAAAETEKSLKKAEADAARSYDRHLAERKLKLRDQVLAAKGEMLDKVFNEAPSRLNSMTRDEYSAYLCRALEVLDTDGETLLLPAKYGITDIGDINAHLKNAGKRGNLTLSNDASRVIDGGFILQKGGIEQNNTFEALVDFHRYRLEADIRSELF